MKLLRPLSAWTFDVHWIWLFHIDDLDGSPRAKTCTDVCIAYYSGTVYIYIYVTKLPHTEASLLVAQSLTSCVRQPTHCSFSK